MMLKTTEITTASGPRAITAHVFRGEDNDEILVLAGCEADVEDFFDDARFHRNRGGTRAGQHALHAVRHVIIAPEIATSREQGEAVARFWCAEFNVPFDRCAFVEHRKPRADGIAWDRHWHLLAPGVVGGRSRGQELGSGGWRPGVRRRNGRSGYSHQARHQGGNLYVRGPEPSWRVGRGGRRAPHAQAPGRRGRGPATWHRPGGSVRSSSRGRPRNRNRTQRRPSRRRIRPPLP